MNIYTALKLSQAKVHAYQREAERVKLVRQARAVETANHYADMKRVVNEVTEEEKRYGHVY